MTIQFHTSKANVVEDALSEYVMSMSSQACLSVSKHHMSKEIQTLNSRFMQLKISLNGGLLASIEIRDTFTKEIKAKQHEDENFYSSNRK